MPLSFCLVGETKCFQDNKSTVAFIKIITKDYDVLDDRKSTSSFICRLLKLLIPLNLSLQIFLGGLTKLNTNNEGKKTLNVDCVKYWWAFIAFCFYCFLLLWASPSQKRPIRKEQFFLDRLSFPLFRWTLDYVTPLTFYNFEQKWTCSVK